MMLKSYSSDDDDGVLLRYIGEAVSLEMGVVSGFVDITIGLGCVEAGAISSNRVLFFKPF